MVTSIAPSEVLIVDDDPVSRLVVRHMLERQGLVVADAEGVDAALVAIEERRSSSATPFAMIVCDYEMPGRSGMELFEHHDGNEPFVLLTGNTIAPVVDQNERFFAHVTKPISSDELGELVELALAAG